MKVQILSDMHHEFGFLDFPFNNTDLLVLAGDVNLGVKGVEWIKATIKDIPVIYVLGNHEYYKGAYPKTLNKIKAHSENSNVHVLENDKIEIDGVTFHGATLWTDFSILGNPKAYGMICQEKMNDYKHIRRDPSYSKLRTIDSFKIHQYSRHWLGESLSESKTSSNIVVTHHAPSIKSVPKHYHDDPLTAAYASDLEEFILKHQPTYWIHGHIHQPSNYQIGETTILCNPQGYIDEKYNGYEKELIVEL